MQFLTAFINKDSWHGLPGVIALPMIICSLMIHISRWWKVNENTRVRPNDAKSYIKMKLISVWLKPWPTEQHGDFFPSRSLWLLCSGSKVATGNIHNVSGRMVILCICIPALFSNNIRERRMVFDHCSTFSIPCLTWVIHLVILEDRVYTPWKCT